MQYSNRRAADGKLGRELRAADRRRKRRFGFESLEDRSLMAAFTAGNVAVLELASTSKNTTGSIVELNPSTPSQASPVQTIAIASSGSTPFRFSDSGTSSFLSDTNDGTLLTFAAYNTTNSTISDLASLTTAGVRAVGTLDSSTTNDLTLQTTYTQSTSGNQTRSATSLDDSHWFITDKGGLFTNGATAPSLSTNILNTRSLGGTVYVSSTSASSAVSALSGPTAASLTGLPGLGADSKIQDFYLIQSGQNGSTYDILYTLDQNSSTAAINKFSLVNGSWVANGSYSAGPLTTGATGMIAENDGSGGAYLFGGRKGDILLFGRWGCSLAQASR